MKAIAAIESSASKSTPEESYSKEEKIPRKTRAAADRTYKEETPS